LHPANQGRNFQMVKNAIIRCAVKESTMGLQTFATEKIQNLDVWDLGCVKASVFFFTLFLAAVLPAVLMLEWYWYLIPALLFAFRPLYRAYKKQ